MRRTVSHRSRSGAGRRTGPARPFCEDGRVPPSLADRLPADADPDALYEAFTAWAADQGLTLYPHQEEALLALVTGSHAIVATPTGSGKSLVAMAAHFVALAQGRRTFYTAPLKALVSEKFFDLVAAFGAQNVGMMTGDSAVNADAPIICCTAEILANIALRTGDGTALETGHVDDPPCRASTPWARW